MPPLEQLDELMLKTGLTGFEKRVVANGHFLHSK
jgi:hypothetical protein